MFGIMTWLASYDQFGSFAKFNYRGESGYGTGCGGFCSMFLTFIGAVFISVQIFGFFWEPSYNQQNTTVYFTDVMGDNSYTMLPGDFLATYWVKTSHDFEGVQYEAWNDPTLFDIFYEVFDKSTDTINRVEAILCTEYINSDQWKAVYTEGQIASALQELQETEYQLCPDITSFVLDGGVRSTTGQGMRFVVTALAGADPDLINDSLVFTSMISQYFTPPLYGILGYCEFISVTESLYDLRDQ